MATLTTIDGKKIFVLQGGGESLLVRLALADYRVEGKAETHRAAMATEVEAQRKSREHGSDTYLPVDAASLLVIINAVSTKPNGGIFGEEYMRRDFLRDARRSHKQLMAANKMEITKNNIEKEIKL